MKVEMYEVTMSGEVLTSFNNRKDAETFARLHLDKYGEQDEIAYVHRVITETTRHQLATLVK